MIPLSCVNTEVRQLLEVKNALVVVIITAVKATAF